MISETWTYASANSVTYAGDLTAIYSPGMRVRLTQGTVKYFVIVSVAYSDPDTTITFYGGGIYSLTEDPITSHDATASAIPQGFPTALLRVSTVLDGFCPALPNDTAKFYRGDGTWQTPAGYVTNGDAHDHSGGDGAQIDHGGLAGLSDDDHPQYIKHSLATAVNDFLVASEAGAFVKKTLAEVKTALGLGSAAYTASTDYATAAKGVTNGDSHDHNGGDGAQVDHGGLAGLSDDDHPQYIKHSLATAANDILVASGAGAFAKKTLAEAKVLFATVRSLQATIDSGDAETALSAGDWIDIYVEYDCTILQWTLLGKPIVGQSSGSVVVDLWKDSYANFNPTVADTITAAAKPTISSSIKGQSSILTDWTTTIPAGSVIRVNVDSCSNLRRLSLSLKVQVA